MSNATFLHELHVHELWQLFNDPEPLVLEVRAIWPKDIGAAGKPVSKCFDSSKYQSLVEFRATVEQHVISLNRLGYNLYATLNPIKAGFEGNAASDQDILCRRRLLIDIDRDHGKEHPATNEEIEAAKHLGDQIAQHFDQLGWPAPVRVMSGNGHHLVYPLPDLPNTKEVTAAIRSLLQNLKQAFSGNGMSVDTTVSNASRITKLPGTLARRGTETANQPYRVARVYE